MKTTIKAPKGAQRIGSTGYLIPNGNGYSVHTANGATLGTAKTFTEGRDRLRSFANTMKGQHELATAFYSFLGK